MSRRNSGSDRTVGMKEGDSIPFGMLIMNIPPKWGIFDGKESSMSKPNKLKTVIFTAVLAAFSAVLQLMHVGYQSPQWGMWIDVVAVSWLVALFLYGVRTAFAVSLLGALTILLFAPDTWLGALMKWTATLPMWLVLGLWCMKSSPVKFTNPKTLIFPVIIALIIRSLIVLPINYTVAIPIWTGMTTAQAISAIPWYIIVGFNAFQGIIDVALAWFLVYPMKLSRYAQWKNEKTDH